MPRPVLPGPPFQRQHHVLSSDWWSSGLQSQSLTTHGFVLNIPPFPETNSREARPKHPPGIHLGSEGEPQLLQGGTLCGQRGQERIQVWGLGRGWAGAQQAEGVCEVGP